MGKKRYVDTIFWRDEYSAGLDPSEKLLFLYLLTNPDTNICGIYQLPLKTMSVDTGFEKEMLLTILGRFEKDEKVLYRNGWVAIKNFIKHQNERSQKVQIGIDNELKNAPKELREWIGKGIDTLSHSDSDSDSDSDSNKPPALFFAIDQYFKDHSAVYYRDAKESNHIKRLETQLKDMDTFLLLAKAFQSLIDGTDEFWRQQPFIPSAMVSLLPRIRQTMLATENPAVKYHREKRERENAGI